MNTDDKNPEKRNNAVLLSIKENKIIEMEIELKGVK